jgi:DNA repair exonuclease SbcCD ATPase subunit
LTAFQFCSICIYQDGELLNQDAAARDYQEYLEKFILKMNYKSFTQIVILGSASFTPFMQLSNTDRRAIIEDLLDIQIFSTMNGLVKEKLSNNKDLSIAKKHEIDIDQQKYELKETHIKQLKQKFRIIMWTILSCDFDKKLNQEKALRGLINKTRKGSIIVFHDSVKAENNLRFLLPNYLQFLNQKGYTCKIL